MERYIGELRDVGLTIIPDAYTPEQVALFVEKISAIAGPMVGDTQNVWSFFRHDHALFDLVYHPTLDAILTAALDADYTLTAADVINRQKRGAASNFANDWHTDSRYLGGLRLDAGFSYSVVIMLDDFTKENGGTHYIPGSHKLRQRPDRQGGYPYRVLTGEAGTMAIFDSGLWHKGGPSSEKRRWGVFNLYSPWFVKPYFDYPKMLGPEFGKQTTKDLRRLLHYNSQPPVDDTERTNTLVRE
jgi:ectoine hydroxylase-related dioxygenase (phytanoyl-CoA dioxygenase family)